MKAHELAGALLKCPDVEITASIDISTSDADAGARIFTDEFFGINDETGHGGEIVLLFGATPTDKE